MFTGMRFIGDALEQAEAIVEAELIRLQRFDAADGQQFYRFVAEMPRPQRYSLAPVVGTATLPRPAMRVGDHGTSIDLGWARRRPWATERSPPGV